jgi:arylsulfatase A-like enzyme
VRAEADADVQVDQPNVLFLMVDCLRADTIWDRQRYPSMPNLDRLAARGSVFTSAIAAFTNTTPSVATMLTGLSPAEHGIRSLLGYKLEPGVRTLAEELQSGGYYTAAEMTGPLFPEVGLDRGFDHYRRRERNWYLDTSWGDELRATLRQRRFRQPWFLFLHIWELHWPRRAAGEFNSDRYGRTLYQRSVAYVDHLIGQVLANVDLDNTVVVLTGDHGEGVAGAIDDPRRPVQLGIHWAYRLTRRLPARSKKRILTLAKRLILVGKRRKAASERPELAGHAALCVYDYLIRVPMLFAGPGFPAVRIDHQVRHLDLAPTILDLAGQTGSPPGWTPSLLPMTRGEEQCDRPAVAEANQSMLHDPVRRLIGYRTGQHKLIYAPENPEVAAELYDLKSDPAEMRDLATARPDLLSELRRRADREGVNRQGHRNEQRMTAEEEQVIRARLEQLGYME